MVTIKKVYFLPIALLLAFICFSVFHTSNIFIQLHHSHKAVLMMDNWNMNSQTDDEEKHLFHLDFCLCTCSIFISRNHPSQNFYYYPQQKLHLSYPNFSSIKLCNLLPCIDKLKTYNKGGKNMWIRFVIIGFFSITAARNAYLPRHRNVPCFHRFL